MHGQQNIKTKYMTVTVNKRQTTAELYIIILLLLQSALRPLVGFRPAQPLLSILSRKVLQSAVASGTSNPPTWRRTRDLERSKFRHKRPPASEATLANPAAEGGTMGEKWPRNFAESGDDAARLRWAGHLQSGQ
jgi:hypothetical protein